MARRFSTAALVVMVVVMMIASFVIAIDARSSFTTLQSMSSEDNDNSDADVDTEVMQSFAEVDAESRGGDAVEHEAAAAASTETVRAAPWHRDINKQPVDRSGKEIECLDGDCTRATAVKTAAVGTHPSASTPLPPTKLDMALGAVKEEIMVRAKELHLEKTWAGKVAKLIDQYQQKMEKVTNNIISLRQQTKALLRQKKKIQNVQVQNKLRDKLELAQADLNRLQKQMEHIAGKENEFSDTEKELKGTMNALKNSLLKLRGQDTVKLVQEGIE